MFQGTPRSQARAEVHQSEGLPQAETARLQLQQANHSHPLQYRAAPAQEPTEGLLPQAHLQHTEAVHQAPRHVAPSAAAQVHRAEAPPSAEVHLTTTEVHHHIAAVLRHHLQDHRIAVAAEVTAAEAEEVPEAVIAVEAEAVPAEAGDNYKLST